jgi:hypothetical protein
MCGYGLCGLRRVRPRQEDYTACGRCGYARAGYATRGYGLDGLRHALPHPKRVVPCAP